MAQLVNAFDPCGLIKSGAPADEYDCLTDKLLSKVYKRKSRQEVEEFILHEIEHHFGLPDLTDLDELYKSQFNRSLDKFLSDIEKTFTQNEKTS
jgi:hypothetical protein